MATGRLRQVALALVLAPAGAAGQGVETWVIHSRACRQEMEVEPWACFTASRADAWGGALVPVPAGALPASAAGRPVVILVHGNNYELEAAGREANEVCARLLAAGGFAPDALFVVFHWPSERVLPRLVRDLDEKARRSRIAGFHLARLLQSFPPGSRVCLLGQSDGARVVLSALHLLAGAELAPYHQEAGVRMNASRPDLRLRAVLLEAAVGCDWLDPGERLGGALNEAEAVLNLYNSRDPALSVYVFGRYTGLRPALGRVGLRPDDLRRLGRLADRVEQYDLRRWSAGRHTLFPEALRNPEVLWRVVRYTGFTAEGAGRETEGW